jgi:hypothetical protein
MGKGYNQLAVVQAAHISSTSQLMAVHGYLRALWAEKAFAPARSNLLHAFAANRARFDNPAMKLPDRFNQLVIRIAEMAFLADEMDDDERDRALSELNAVSRSLALSRSYSPLPNLSYVLIILLGLADVNPLAWQALADIFAWQMTSLAITTAPRNDLILAIFCICACRRLESLAKTRLLIHIAHLANTLTLDGIGEQRSPKATDSTALDLFVQFSPVESIPGWASVVDGLCHQPDFLARSVKTLATLTLHFDAPTNRYDVISTAAPLVVLDVPNICMKHGKDRVFSCKGLALVVHYFVSRGLLVRAFVPEQCIDYEKVAALKRLGRLEGWATKASAMPDDIALLRVHYVNGVVVTTPQVR